LPHSSDFFNSDGNMPTSTGIACRLRDNKIYPSYNGMHKETLAAMAAMLFGWFCWSGNMERLKTQHREL